MNADNENMNTARGSNRTQTTGGNRAGADDRACDPQGKRPALCESAHSRMVAWLFTPILAPIMQNRRLLAIFAGIAILQVGLKAADLEGWRCPIQSVLGATCPGCGLTTALVLLCRGQWQAAVTVHAFAPLALMVLILMAFSGSLPADYRRAAARRVAALERRTGAVALVLFTMLFHWLIKIFEII